MGVQGGSITTDIIKNGLVFNVDAANRASTIPSTSTLKTFNTIDLSQSGSIVTDATWTDTTVTPSFNFDGTDGYIGTNISLNTLGISTTFSISCWVNISTNGNYDTIIAAPTSYAAWNTGFALYCNGSGIRFWVEQWNGSNQYVETATLSTDQWYNITATFDTTNGLKLYVNGSTLTTASGTTIDGLTNTIYIGSTGTNTTYGFIGNTSPIHIYNRALLANEVLHNYNALKGRFGL